MVLPTMFISMPKNTNPQNMVTTAISRPAKVTG